MLINARQETKKPPGSIINRRKDGEKWDNFHSQKQNIQTGDDEQNEKTFLI